jgi:hypothetical protein
VLAPLHTQVRSSFGVALGTALTEFGSLLETFAVGELRKQVCWLDEQVSSGYWRTHDGDEVDFVVEFDDGRVLAFEVKANERVSGRDLKGLRKLRDALGDRLIAGVALSTGLRMASRAIAFPWPTATLRSSRDDCPRSHTNLLGWLTCMRRPSCTFVCRRGRPCHLAAAAVTAGLKLLEGGWLQLRPFPSPITRRLSEEVSRALGTG